MRNERWRFALYTRLRDESLHHSAHRLNQRCIGCCESTGRFVSALVSPAAMVDTCACVPCLASALPPDSVSVLTLLMHFQGQCGFGVMRGISSSPRVSIHRASRRFPCHSSRRPTVLVPRKTLAPRKRLDWDGSDRTRNQTHDDCQTFDTCRNPATAVASLGQHRLARRAPKQSATS
jgi:hypothetical protein